ncbi:ABC transporter ATP-binding protein [Amycolatopsis benzoatilytica]|uniref:ABC transporter ATP-binding protein n=1 Tax=Amycolatopsis benzoatilytica TaxID=346045 RepID=UPI00039A4790|nr:ABC transporter ATP-binding protein [Amycolatopsis benzoatilytica]
MSNEAVIEISDLHLDYGTFTAVDGISLTVAPGQVLALLGTNGAGKTTTVDVLTGFQRPTSGTVRVLGADPVTERRKIATRVGIVLQEAGFFENLTVAETVDAWRRFTPGARPRAEALEMVDLARRAGVPVGKLSGGEKRRLDLTLGLLGGPEVLFLDEPTTGLDPEARRNVWQLLRELILAGMTVLLTTHYMEEAEALADRVAIMDRGRIVREGTLAEITARSATAISFRLPSAFSAADLPPLDGGEPAERDGRILLHTHEPQRTLAVLLGWADERGAQLAELDVSAGSLEDAFLAAAAGERSSR